MNTTKKATTKAVAKLKQEEAVVPVLADKGRDFRTIMEQLGEMEMMRNGYNKLLAKRDALVAALDRIADTKGPEHFEDSDSEAFPFEVVLRGKGEYNQKGDIFKITKKQTVENFTRVLLKEVDQVLEVLKADILERSITMN